MSRRKFPFDPNTKFNFRISYGDDLDKEIGQRFARASRTPNPDDPRPTKLRRANEAGEASQRARFSAPGRADAFQEAARQIRVGQQHDAPRPEGLPPNVPDPVKPAPYYGNDDEVDVHRQEAIQNYRNRYDASHQEDDSGGEEEITPTHRAVVDHFREEDMRTNEENFEEATKSTYVSRSNSKPGDHRRPQASFDAESLKKPAQRYRELSPDYKISIPQDSDKLAPPIVHNKTSLLQLPDENERDFIHKEAPRGIAHEGAVPGNGKAYHAQLEYTLEKADRQHGIETPEHPADVRRRMENLRSHYGIISHQPTGVAARLPSEEYLNRPKPSVAETTATNTKHFSSLPAEANPAVRQPPPAAKAPRAPAVQPIPTPTSAPVPAAPTPTPAAPQPTPEHPPVDE